MMRYSTGAIALHWLIALLIATNFVLVWLAHDLPREEHMQMMGQHKAVGITVLVLSAVRIVWRLVHKAPPFAPGLKAWEVRLAHIVHGLLYLVMIGLPLAGWLLHSAYSGGAGIDAFGLFSYPGLPLAKDKALAEGFGELHEALALGLLALLALHVAGALKHQFVDRDEGMRRMWFGKGQPGS